jgi:hypothetical protein
VTLTVYSPEDMQFCRSEYEARFEPQEAMLEGIEDRCAKFLPDGPAAVPFILEKASDALRDGKSLSLLRVGNGEGNVVSMVRANLHPTLIRAYYDEFESQNGIPIPVDASVEFCRRVVEAISSSDVIGFRSFKGNDQRIIESDIANNNAYAALGILYAREFLQDGLKNRRFKNTIVTSAWIHLDILPKLDELLGFTEKTIVISGRWQLEGEFSARYPNKDIEFISVPVQGFMPQTERESHYSSAFPNVLKRLEGDLRGVLVLVGAGLFGKIYCGAAKKNGAVALDLGSAFDILAGLETRPVHKSYDWRKYAWL